MDSVDEAQQDETNIQPGDVGKTARSLYADPLIPHRENLSTPASEQHVSVCSCLQLVEQEENRRMESGKRKDTGLEESGAAYEPNREYAKLGLRKKQARIFTVMCYNVLCDKYATRQMYGYCPSWALDWEYRKKGILDEIRHYAADIISLQEVETDQFYNFFLPELKHDGYDGIFSPKSRAKTMAENDRKYVDGCAIFYRTAKFSLIKEHLVEFNQLAMANAEGSDNMLNRVMPKDNIGLAALLRTKEAAWDNDPTGLFCATEDIVLPSKRNTFRYDAAIPNIEFLGGKETRESSIILGVINRCAITSRKLEQSL
ncbi:CCR4-NOT transcription complex subunit 6 [Camponotus floridanus]|uniref:CCR4-NOT transcription complex subunit 6 n=1 Tax=Camponotus floridanus TaxID=104421 RepID=E1ZYX0_CAMFO|nr:CCR4-NOT transcription complex subunit 6 [Camponotus floridanus]